MRLTLSLLFILLVSFTTHATTINADKHPDHLYGYEVQGDGNHRRLTPLPVRPVFVFGVTYYVRNDGSPNCNGLENAPYPGVGSNVPCAFRDVRQAIAVARYGDIIRLHAGDTFDTPGQFASFDLTAKGPPPTGTDADFITITTDDETGIPAALSRYPHEDTRITTAMAAKMPVVRTVGSFPVFWVNKGARYWRIKGLNITAVPGANSIRLIGLGEDDPRSRAEYPDHIDIEQNWIRPPEETGTPLSASNIVRSAQNAIYLEGTNIRIRQNAIQGFVGREPGPGGTLTSAGHLMTTWADGVLVENNLIEAWTYSVFYGGGSKGFADPNATATVSSCTATSCVFSNTAGLSVGKPVAVLVYTHIDSIGIFREVWGTAFVASVAGSTVNFQKPLCNSNNTGGNGNVCKPFDSANLRQLPADGSPARWEGYQVQNVLVRRNILAHRPEWTGLMGNNCGGKGYLELKSCHTCTFDANIFKGCTGPTITTRNQGGPDPWNDLDNLTLSNNWFWNANSPFTAYLNDDGNLTSRTRNVSYVNNLVVGEYADPNDFSWFRVISNNFSGSDGIRLAHNTILVGSARNFISSSPNTMNGLVLENNIIRAASNQCFDFTSGEERGAPITTCWPNATVRSNVLMSIDATPTSDINASWLTHYPNNSLVTTVAGVGFVAPDAGLTAAGDYRLAATSPFKGRATDGKDPGADIDALNAAIFGSSQPPPFPSPTPVASPTPISPPTPTPAPTPTIPLPSPSPTVQPTVSPTPVPSPPTGTVRIQGVVRERVSADVYLAVEGATVEVAGMRTTSRAGDGYWWFDSPVAIGREITTTKAGYDFPVSVVAAGTVEQHYFITGGRTSEPLPSPTPQPSATPLPSPEPSPTVAPSPQPTPPPLNCEMAIAVPTMSQRSTALMTVRLNGPLPQSFTVTATPDTGQLTVTPRSQSFSGVTSVTATFKLQSKQKSANVVVVGPCGGKTVMVNVQ